MSGRDINSYKELVDWLMDGNTSVIAPAGRPQLFYRMKLKKDGNIEFIDSDEGQKHNWSKRTWELTFIRSGKLIANE